MEEIFEISNKNKKKNKEKKKLMTNLVKEEKNEVYSSHLLNPIIQQAMGEPKSLKNLLNK